jgi:hypothetical protein
VQLIPNKGDSLGHVVSEKGIDVDPDKVRVVNERREPANLEELRSFLGMTGYYRGHIKGYAHMASPLHALTKKNVPWKWGPDEAKGYHGLLTALVGDTILAHPRVVDPRNRRIGVRPRRRVTPSPRRGRTGHPLCK